MAEWVKGRDVVSEFLVQNPHLTQWMESLRGYCETNKQWRARQEFILRNIETFPSIIPGVYSPSLDHLLSLSMVWANHVFLRCRYPPGLMQKVLEMAEGIVIQEVPVRQTRDEIMEKKEEQPVRYGRETDSSMKKLKTGGSEAESNSGVRAVGRAGGAVPSKTGPPPQAPAEQQPFFNRLYKSVAWKLVSAGGFGPNLDHFDILRACVEASKASLICVFVPLRDIPDLPAGCAQREGQVCELRCRTVYMGTGYGRDEDSARAMASKEALKVFQGRKVTVRICRRRYQGRDVEDLVLLDEQARSSALPPALSYPFPPEQPVTPPP
ncbi:CDKN2A-interacting protein [Megalops cyprinoides]|uniref:CDKN2A-interacting protein n=1 Tax=Megalops cyprinoides TaxID=118141 RepID=UPI001863D18C|nr:CDKN2A-interacting protein [Megalops cyprinoides]